MTGFALTCGQGNVKSGQYDFKVTPNVPRPTGKYPAILLHGMATNDVYMFSGPSYGWNAAVRLGAVLGNAGIPWVSAYLDGTAYANATSLASLSGCYTYLGNPAKAHLFGISGGFALAARFAALNPSLVASVTGVCGAASLQNLYQDNPNNVLPGGFADGIANVAAWNLTYRTVTDAVLNGTTTLTSATAAFTTADNNRVIVGDNATTGQKGIDKNTRATFVNATTITLSKPALISGTGQHILIGDPLPTTGNTGADLIGYYAPLLASNGIPVRMYYPSDDPYIYAGDTTAFATAAGGTAIALGTGGHANATMEHVATYNGGSEFSDYVAFLLANGA